MVWKRNGTTNTLGTAADIITISNLSSYKFNVFLDNVTGSTTVDIDQGFNNNTGTVYAVRKESNGAGDGTATSDTKIDKNTTATTIFDVNYACAIVGEEKLVIGFLINQSTAGATTAPNRLEYVAKFVPAVDAPLSRVDIINTGTTNEYSIGSNLSALGTD